MTGDDTDDSLGESEMGSHLSRLTRPFVLAGPLMALVVIPAVLYGQRSRDVAAEADRALVASLVTEADGAETSIAPEFFCDASGPDTLTNSFAELQLNGVNHKTSVTGIGFDRVRVDMKGRIEESSGVDDDDIMVRLQRSGETWCVSDIDTFTSTAE